MIGYICFLVIGLFLTFIIYGLHGYNSGEFGFFYAFIVVIINFLIIFILDIIISFIIHKLPRKYFNPNLNIYSISKKEKKFYVLLGIKKWKDLIPDMGSLCDFKKEKVESKDPKYLFKFLEETCYAESIHIGMILIGFCDILFFINNNIFIVTIPLVFINFFLNFPPILIQRYNRPRLLNLYKYQLSHS